MAVDPYGKTMLRGHLLYFILFEYFEGEPLSDVLRRNPQLWIQHVGWIMLSLAVTINYLNAQGRYHFGLSLTASWFTLTKTQRAAHPAVRPGYGEREATPGPGVLSFGVPPAYMAPELVEAQRDRSCQTIALKSTAWA